jgi:hypothetical protein
MPEHLLHHVYLPWLPGKLQQVPWHPAVSGAGTVTHHFLTLLLTRSMRS